MRFGWSYPAGCAGTPYDEFPPCGICGVDPSECDCPECPVCGEQGALECYDLAHLPPAHDSVQSLCDHLGIEPIADALRAVERHNVEQIYLVMRVPHPRTGQVRVYPRDRAALEFLPAWTRIGAVGVSGIAWDGSAWEWCDEVPAGDGWTALDDAREAFHSALEEEAP